MFAESTLSEPYCSIVIVNDGEHRLGLLEYCLQGLADLNADVMGECEVLVLNQDPDGADARALCANHSLPMQWHEAAYPVVGGVPLWDLMSSLRDVRPRLHGQYLLVLHKEFVWSPGALVNALSWLREHQNPMLAAANLRRLGEQGGARHWSESVDAETSAVLEQALDTGDVEQITDAIAETPTRRWAFWQEEAVRWSGKWLEDVFFARLDWLDSIRFFGHAERCLFVDIYDVMRRYWQELDGRSLAPRMERIPDELGSVMHLYHPKGYPHFGERLQGYFGQNPAKWENTRFTPDEFREIHEFNTDPYAGIEVTKSGEVKRGRNRQVPFRWHENGAVWRYHRRAKQWLDNGGADDLRQWLGSGKIVDPPRRPTSVVLAPDCRCLLMAENREWRDVSMPFRALRAGLDKLGHPAEVVAVNRKSKWPFVAETPDCVWVWNGGKGYRGKCASKFSDRGIPVFLLERGFFRRHQYTQADPCGFNHTASWVARLPEPAPDGGAERFAEVWGGKPSPMRKRAGYMLVLLQTPGDSQLAASFYQSPGPLVRAVEAACPDGLDIRVRAHPLHKWGCGTACRSRMIGGTLQEAVEGAAFCVTNNSNAGNEALAWGCPVLSIGPSLYSAGGVSPTCTPATLRDHIEMMAEGWRPDRAKLNNYLYWLAARQWSQEEIADGECLRSILAETA